MSRDGALELSCDLIVAGVVLAVQVFLVMTGMVPGLQGGAIRLLSDPDAYTHALRVLELWGGGPWFDTALHVIHPPEGLPLHWTRAFDLSVLAVAVPLKALTGWEAREVLLAVGLYLPPAVMVAVAIGLRRHSRPFVSRAASMLIVPVLIMSWEWLASFRLGILDHNLLILGGFAVAYAAVFRSLTGAPGARPGWAGLAAGLALWAAAPEGGVVLALGLGVLLSAWIIGGADLRAARRFADAALVTAAVALAVERVPADWLSVENDRLSVIHVGAILVIALALRGLMLAEGRFGPRSVSARFGAAALVFGLAAVAGVLALPAWQPLADTGPYARMLVVPNEYAYSLATPNERVQFTVGPGESLPPLLYLLVLLRDPQRRTWAFAHAAPIAAMLAGCFLTSRLSPYLQIACAVPWMLMVRDVWAAVGRSPLRPAPVAATALAVALLVWPYPLAAAQYGIGKLAFPAKPNTDRLCRFEELAEGLDRLLPDRSGVVATSMHAGPQFAFETGRPVIAGPYHRAEAALRDYHTFFFEDPNRAAEVAQRLGVTALVLCSREVMPMSGLAQHRDAVMVAMMRRELPPWLRRVQLPPELAQKYRVFVVAPPAG
ncbi:hypothetical protein [Azospirillum sp. sgz301742]